jgi:hypothetical protein
MKKKKVKKGRRKLVTYRNKFISYISISNSFSKKREEKRPANPFRGKISIGPRAASSLMYENGKKSK